MKKNIINILLFCFLLISFSCSVEKKMKKNFELKNIKELNSIIAKKEKYIPITDPSHFKKTPLLYAIEKNDKKSINLYLKYGASYTEKDSRGMDTFDYAFKVGNIEYINFCINEAPKEYWRATDFEGIPRIAKLFKIYDDDYMLNEIAKKINYQFPLTDRKKKTILMYAAQYNSNLLAIKSILDRSQSLINKKNNNEWTALMYATRYNFNPLVTETLIKRGASLKPNSAGLTYTMLAVCNKNPAILLTILSHTDEVNEQTVDGRTALMYALENNSDISIIELLLANGALVELKDKNGKNALLYAAEKYKDEKLFSLLLNSGADIFSVDSKDNDIFYYLKKNTSLGHNSKLIKYLKNLKQANTKSIVRDKTSLNSNPNIEKKTEAKNKDKKDESASKNP